MECRSGTLFQGGDFFIHGVPTESAGSVMMGEEAPRCGCGRCRELQTESWTRMFLEGAAWADMAALECDACKGERLARGRVAFSDQDPRFQQPPFEAAPYIHPNNLPKYYAQQQRAIVFAKQRQRCVNWVVAHDKPLHQDDQALSDEVLNKKRLRWLG